MFISFVFKIKLHFVLFHSSEFNAESLAEFIPETIICLRRINQLDINSVFGRILAPNWPRRSACLY